MPGRHSFCFQKVPISYDQPNLHKCRNQQDGGHHGASCGESKHHPQFPPKWRWIVLADRKYAPELDCIRDLHVLNVTVSFFTIWILLSFTRKRILPHVGIAIFRRPGVSNLVTKFRIADLTSCLPSRRWGAPVLLAHLQRVRMRTSPGVFNLFGRSEHIFDLSPAARSRRPSSPGPCQPACCTRRGSAPPVPAFGPAGRTLEDARHLATEQPVACPRLSIVNRQRPSPPAKASTVSPMIHPTLHGFTEIIETIANLGLFGKRPDIPGVNRIAVALDFGKANGRKARFSGLTSNVVVDA